MATKKSKTGNTATKPKSSGTGKGTASRPAGNKRPAARPAPAPSRNPLVAEALSLLCACAGLLLALSLYSQSGAGFLGGFLNELLLGLFGVGAYLLPMLIIGASLIVLFSKAKRITLSKGIMGVWLFIAGISFFSVLYYNTPDAVFTGFSYLTVAYEEGAANNGGLFGAVFGGFLLKFLGNTGACIVLAFVFAALLVLVSGKSLAGLISGLYARASGAWADYGERRRANLEDSYYGEDEYEEYEEYEIYGDGSAAKKGGVKSSGYSDDLKPLLIKGLAPKDGGRRSKDVFKDIPTDAGDEDGENGEELLLFSPGKERNTPQKSRKSIFGENGDGTPRVRLLDVGGEAGEDKPDREPTIDLYDGRRAPQAAVKALRKMPAPEKADYPPFDLDEPEDGGMGEGFSEYFTDANTDTDHGQDHGISIKGTGIEGYVPKALTPDSAGKPVPVAAAGAADGGIPSMPAIPSASVPASPGQGREYIFPPVELLRENTYTPSLSSRAQILENSRKLEETLKSFGVEARVVEVSKGPSVTRYELSPGHGVKVSKISGLADDLALNLAAAGIRIEAPIPGKSVVGIEIPNKEVQSVYLREVIDDDAFWSYPSKLGFALGKDIAGNIIIADIAKMPHLLIAGATGSGKSVCINTLITSILYKSTPEEVKLLMIDPKVVELSVYNGIPHLHIPVVSDPKKAAGALNWAVKEMDLRYNMFAETHTRDLKGYNAVLSDRGEPSLPQIVIIIDELADLMMTCGKEVEEAICRLAQKARAAGIHLIIATQRPSVDVITGLIKANIPSRLAFAVSSGTDSRTILDMVGAEKLLGKGDMLFSPVGLTKPQRIQGSFISDKEVENIVNFIKSTSGEAEYDEELIEKVTASDTEPEAEDGSDDLSDEAVSFLIDKGRASVSMLQRRFRIGYNRAARMMEDLEHRGIVGPEDGSKPRAVLITRYQWQEYKERRKQS